MIWFDIKELELGLKNEKLSDKTTFNYLLANLIMFTLASFASRNEYTTNALLLLEIVVTLSITIIGTKRAFDINAEGDNKDFLKRYLSLSFVLGVRLAVFLAFPIFIVSGITKGDSGANTSMTDLLGIFMTGGIGVFYYMMLSNSFKRVSRNSLLKI